MIKVTKYIASSVLCAVLATLAGSAQAHGFQHEGWRRGYSGGGNWIAPALIGGVIGYELSRPTTVYVQPPVIYQQPVYNSIPQAPYGFHYENLVDAQCNCYRTVLVPN